MFSFTDPSYPNAALGIEADNISAVALSGGKGNYSIRQAASVQMLPGVLVPSFTDTNIQDNTAFANALTAHDVAFGAKTRRAVGQGVINIGDDG